MQARNFTKFPDALLAQRELELVIAAPATLTAEASSLIGKSIRANIAWVCEFATKRAKSTAPQWFIAMKRRAATLAKKVKAACMNLFSA